MFIPHIAFLDTRYRLTFLIFFFIQHVALCYMPFLIANTIFLVDILANVLVQWILYDKVYSERDDNFYAIFGLIVMLYYG